MADFLEVRHSGVDLVGQGEQREPAVDDESLCTDLGPRHVLLDDHLVRAVVPGEMGHPGVTVDVVGLRQVVRLEDPRQFGTVGDERDAVTAAERAWLDHHRRLQTAEQVVGGE